MFRNFGFGVYGGSRVRSLGFKGFRSLGFKVRGL